MDDFKKAIELLKKVQLILTMEPEEFSDGEIVDSLYELKIGEFLSKIKNNEV